MDEGKKPEVDEEDQKESFSTDYGCLGFRPACLQWLNRPGWLVVVLCTACTAQSIAVGGLLGVNLSTIERRFGFSGAQSSLIPALYEVAGLLVTILVGYIGGRGSRPLWVGSGLLLLTFGTFLFALPHFVTGPYSWDSTSITEENVCYPNRTRNNTDDECDQETENLSGYLSLFIIAYCIMGIGSVPLYNLGITYMDDVIRRDRAALYMGIFYAWANLGPAAAYAGAGFLLDIYTDVDRGIDPEISRSDPRWVGAWWIGYLAMAVMSFIAAVPMLGYPRDFKGAAEMRAKRKSEAHKGTGEEPETDRSSLKDVLRSTKIILSNPTFLCITVGGFMDSLVVTGFTNYGPKFLEYQFSLTPGMAGAVFGIMVVPGGAGGSFLGSYLVKRYNMTCKQLVKWMFILAVGGLCTGVMFFIQCDNAGFAGVNKDYGSRFMGQYEEDLDAGCNLGCGCSRLRFGSVCGSDNTLYFSPCYAGCQDWVDQDGTKEYHNCSCIEAPLGALPIAKPEPCDTSCVLMPLFAVIFLISMVMTFVTGLFNISATLRCVPAREKSFALSIAYFASKLFGSFPGPLIFGAAMDISCVLWGETCEGQGSCLYYKNSTLGYAMMLVGVTVKTIAGLAYFIGWRLYKPPPDAPETEVISDNDVKAIEANGIEKDVSGVPNYQSNGQVNPSTIGNLDEEAFTQL